MEQETQRRGAKVVDAVLAAALEELARVGFAGMSMEEVAARAGVNKTTVYRRWPTKLDLVRAALEDKARNKTLPDTGNVRDDLFTMVVTLWRLLATPKGRGLSLALMGADPEVAELARELRERHSAPRDLIRRAIARGELPEDVDAGIIVESIFGAVHSRALMHRAEVDESWARRLVDVVIDGAIDGAKSAKRDKKKGEREHDEAPASALRPVRRRLARKA